MKFTVTKKPKAEAKLAQLWIESSNRFALTVASNAIDRMLQNDPQDVGESRDGPYRVLIVAPLGVYFEVLPEDRMASVVAIWEI